MFHRLARKAISTKYIVFYGTERKSIRIKNASKNEIEKKPFKIDKVYLFGGLLVISMGILPFYFQKLRVNGIVSRKVEYVQRLKAEDHVDCGNIWAYQDLLRDEVLSDEKERLEREWFYRNYSQEECDYCHEKYLLYHANNSVLPEHGIHKVKSRLDVRGTSIPAPMFPRRPMDWESEMDEETTQKLIRKQQLTMTE